MILTPEELHAAALELCRLRGHNPFAQVSEEINMAFVSYLKREIARHCQVQQALATAVMLPRAQAGGLNQAYPKPL